MHGILRMLCLSCMLPPLVASVSQAGKIPKPPELDYAQVHEDIASGQLYVSMDSGIMANHDSLIARLQQIRKTRTMDMWGDKIVRIELFSDKHFARPRELVPKQERRYWADHYLAEFDSNKNVVWLYPAVPARKKRLNLVKVPGKP